jgi:hypothetical protein
MFGVGASRCCSCQAFTCLRGSRSLPQGFSKHFDPPTQLSTNSACLVSFRTPATHYRQSPPPHLHILRPSQWRLRYVLLIWASPPLLAGGLPLVCSAINMLTWPQRERYDKAAAAPANEQHIDTAAARLSSPGSANRLSAMMVSPRGVPSAMAAHANSNPHRDGHVHEGSSQP